MTALLARRLGAGPWLAALAALLMAVRPGITVHGMGGLETPLFMLLLLASIYTRTRAERTPRDDVVSGLCLGLAALTRPEGMLLFGLLELADVFAACVRRSGFGPWFMGVVRRGIPFVLIVGVHMAWRVNTYDGPENIQMFIVYYDPRAHEHLDHSVGLEKGLIGVVNAFAAPNLARTNNVVIAHEFLHTLGATDKYHPETNQPLYPIGYAEPERQPLHPQRKAEIMGGRIPLSEQRAEMPDSLRQSLIGPETALEIRWTD